MSEQRPRRESMSIDEATISNMWEIAAVVAVLRCNPSLSPTGGPLPSRLR